MVSAAFFPLANLVATGQLKLGDFVRIDMQDNRSHSSKRPRERLSPLLLEKYGQKMGGAAAAGAGARPARTTAAKREFGPNLLDK